ncbi:FliH/SctL family protein [Undibacterium sp. TJN19]|uniref:FliH/SctL family protein n=1 Tax=Undibacterium sp. TJN19 TaxID=3413055 RepID=UPI003BEF6C1D
MASIIRSPILSGNKRKLATRASKEKNEQRISGSSVSPDEDPGEHMQLKLEAATSDTVSGKSVETLVEQARLSVLAQIKDEAEAAKELGRQRGLREGRQAGMEEAKAEFASEFARIKSITEKLPQAIESGIQGIEDVAVAIVFESVCKILGKTVLTPDGIQGIVREVALRVSAKEKLTIRINPADMDILRTGGVLEAKTSLQIGDTVTWIADAGIAFGGCVLETEVGDLDARLETQLENLLSTLRSARNSFTVS